MSNKILVTDSLFIFDEHIKKLKAAGFEIERLNKPEASEAELCEAVKGKVGYILGGVEYVPEKVIHSADSLKAIAFTGTNWKEHITGWKLLKSKGIKVINTPHANSNAIAEWMFATGLAMTRNLFVLGRTGQQTSLISHELSELNVGIVGLGHVGKRLADLFAGAGAKHVSYWNRSNKKSKYQSLQLDDLLQTSDIIAVCVSEETGKNFINESMINKIKDDSIITMASPIPSLIDEKALLKRLQKNELRAYFDFRPTNPDFLKLGLGIFYYSNKKTAYNAYATNQRISDMATESIINIIKTGKDKHRVY